MVWLCRFRLETRVHVLFACELSEVEYSSAGHCIVNGRVEQENEREGCAVGKDGETPNQKKKKKKKELRFAEPVTWPTWAVATEPCLVNSLLVNEWPNLTKRRWSGC